MSKYKIRQSGFTLIEMVIGIVLLSIAMIMISSMLLFQTTNSIEPINRLKGSQLAQGVMYDILSHDFEELDDFSNKSSFATFVPANNFIDRTELFLRSQYRNYFISIDVRKYQGKSEIKKIELIVKTPTDEELRFFALKGNHK